MCSMNVHKFIYGGFMKSILYSENFIILREWQKERHTENIQCLKHFSKIRLRPCVSVTQKLESVYFGKSNNPIG